MEQEQSEVQKANTNVTETLEASTELPRSGVSTEREQSPSCSADEIRGDPVACCKLVETITDQIKFLRGAVERGVELSRQRQNESGSNSEEAAADIAEQIIKLKAMLSAKREQVSSLLQLVCLLFSQFNCLL